MDNYKSEKFTETDCAGPETIENSSGSYAEADVTELTRSYPQPIGEMCNQGVNKEKLIGENVRQKRVGEMCSSQMQPCGKRRKKTEVTRALPSQKGVLKKRLRDEKRKTLDVNWWGSPKNSVVFPLVHPGGLYTLERDHCQTLRRRKRLGSFALDAYMSLMRERERKMVIEGHKLKSSFFFVPTHFMVFAPQYMDDRCSREKKQKFYQGCIGSELERPISPPIPHASYIFFPTCVKDHWILFVFCVAEWSVIVLDPLLDDIPPNKLQNLYSRSFLVLERVVPDMLREFHPDRFPQQAPRFLTIADRPKQKNTFDCGVLVCKYMDFLCHGKELMDENWSEEDVVNFRYRIAHELSTFRARKLSKVYVDLRTGS